MISLILSLISGLLTGLSFNLPNFSFLIWFSIAPFIYAISRGRFKIRIFSGIIFAFSFYGLTLFWVANVTSLGLILLLFYLSVYSVIFSLLGRNLCRKPLKLIALPCLWVILEFLKESIWCGFGWANLGYSQYENLYLIQVADLAGTKLISFLIVIGNVLIFEVFLFLKQRDREPGMRKNILKKTIIVLFAFMICFLYSVYRLGNLKETDFVEVSIVQPNIPQELKWEPFARLKVVNALSSLAEETEKSSLVIFPEASWPLTVGEDNFYELEQFIRGLNRDVLIGAVVESGGEFFNEALLFDQEAELINTYRKIKLVPFGEYVPLRNFLTFISVFNSIGDMSRGREFVSFSYKKKKFSALICFEDIFPKHVMHFARGNDFLVNITNDAWFKGEPQAGQHFSIMTLRALENRISIIRSANTGISGWVSFKGEIEKFKKNKKEVFFAGTKNFEISLNEERSFYNKHGDFFPFICAIFLLGIFIRKSQGFML
ncbi:MAG: apolipoprotein N-acyltransferase [Candidatus Omnitrophica bacterium]|nr:apolipoprotein N-acyltransferase [Candidatus Omnitrophota bacterium]